MTSHISPESLLDLIIDGESEMDHQDLRIWDLIKFEPSLWSHEEMGQVWAVGLTGSRVIWHDHWEDGFNISKWEKTKVLNEWYSCPCDLSKSIRVIRAWIDQ